MGKYLKEFASHNGYTAYTADTENFILPNVSYCVQENEVHMMPYEEPDLGHILATVYNQHSSMTPTLLYKVEIDDVIFDKMKVDGVEVSIPELDESNCLFYTFNSSGNHVVNFILKDDITALPEYAFHQCTRLVSVVIPSVITSIGECTFEECNGLTNITIPNSVTSISESAFQDCDNLMGVNIGSGLTSIGNNAFYQCYGLTNVTFAEGSQLTSIGTYAFGYCTGLTSINIPSGVTTIGDGAFEYCGSLSSVTCLPTTPPTLSYGAFDENASGRKIYVPSESETAYEQAINWSDYAADIEPIP